MASFINKMALVLPAISLMCCMGGIVLARLEVLRPTMGMMIFTLGGLVGGLSVLAALLVVLFTRAWPLALIALVGLLPLLAVISAASAAFRYPRINDITTDTATPPAFVHAPTLQENAGRDMDFPTANTPLIQEHYIELQGLELPLPAGEAYERALQLASRMPDWLVTHKQPEAHTFEAVVTTRLFRWRDDVVVRVTPLPEGGSRIDMRSKSRDGRSDLGANARRIQAFLEKLRL